MSLSIHTGGRTPPPPLCRVIARLVALRCHHDHPHLLRAPPRRPTVYHFCPPLHRGRSHTRGVARSAMPRVLATNNLPNNTIELLMGDGSR